MLPYAAGRPSHLLEADPSPQEIHRFAISNLGTVLKAKSEVAAAEPLLRESRLAPRFLELTA